MNVVMHSYDGRVYVADRPSPVCQSRQILCRGAFGWISSGTEGRFLRERRANPPADSGSYPLGYTVSGVIKAVGEDTPGFEAGMAVGLYGSPYVFQAEELAVGRNLAAAVPEGVGLAEASSVGLGAIAMHGLRRIELTLGDVVVHWGLGPLGLIAVQIAEAMGAEVIALDLLASRVAVANEVLGRGRAFVADEVDLGAVVADMTRGRGADAAVVCVSGSRAVEQNIVELLRDRGRVSLLGGGSLGAEAMRGASRKELEIKHVRAGGPGRRDRVYEAEGVDYPVGYVPWTEGRNMEAYLRLLADGRVDVGAMMTHCFDIDDAASAWELVVERPEETLGVLVNLWPERFESPAVRGAMG